MVDAAADRSVQLRTVPGDDATRARLGSVLAELHTEAGWDSQLDALTATGCDRVFTDALSGARDHRPGLTPLLDYARTG